MFILLKSSRSISARRQIDIKGVRDGVLMLSRNRYRIVLEVSPVNFELRSEDEQDLLIDVYESFLNSLPCSLQIIVRIRELDVAKYLSDLQTRLSEEKEDVYRSQIESYGEFVRHLVAENKILSRRFYVVLSFSGEDADFETAKERLIINADIVAKNFMRLGMGTYQLGSLEVLHLFQGFYNPAKAKQQPITERVTQLLSSIYVRGEK